MPDRKSLIITLWVTGTLALLATALFAPSRTLGFATVSSRHASLPRNFILPLGQPTTLLSAAKATDAVLQVDALPSESEEQDRADARDEPRVSFLIPCSFRKVSDRQPIAPRSIFSLYPLRC
jgi:ligand-binding sensor domain-containing protein